MRRWQIAICIIIIVVLFIGYFLIKPKIILLGNEKIYLTLNHQYIELGAKAISFNRDISNKINIDGKVDSSKLGTYVITYTVKTNITTTKVKRVITIIDTPPVKKSTIYLTFDDGPSKLTSKLLDILEEENVKATFFVVNWDEKYDDVVERIVEDGHAIGLHGYIHSYHNNYSSVEAYFNDLGMIHYKVKEITGVDSRIIRFIGGSSNTTSRFNPKIMTKLTKEVLKRKYYYFDWNIDSNDTRRMSSKRIYKNVIRKLKNEDTYIILMHDYNRNKKILTALRKIIEYGKDNGYTFSYITKKTKPTNHKVRN